MNDKDREVLKRASEQMEIISNELKKELPYKFDAASNEQTRQMVSYFEAQQPTLIAIQRWVGEIYDREFARKYEAANHTEEKMTADAKKAWVNGELADIKAMVNQSDNLLKCVRGKVMLGQSFIKAYDNGFGV